MVASDARPIGELQYHVIPDFPSRDVACGLFLTEKRNVQPNVIQLSLELLGLTLLGHHAYHVAYGPPK